MTLKGNEWLIQMAACLRRLLFGLLTFPQMAGIGKLEGNQMNDEQKLAFRWALNQGYQSVAARYARTLALYVAEHTGDIEAIQGVK
jgi:hypothetical protein